MPGPTTPTSDWSADRHTSIRRHARAGTYTIFLGGRTVGDRLNTEYKDYVPYDQVVAELVPVFVRFKAERTDGESFGDFCDRIGVEELARSASPELNPVG